MSSKRGPTLNSQAREQVVKLYNYFERECLNDGPLIPLSRKRERVAEALGIGKKTVSQILKEKYGPSGDEDNILRSPKKRRRNPRADHFDTAAIRNHIYGYYLRNQYPTSKKLLGTLKEEGLFNGGKSTLITVLKSIGFEYKESDKRKILVENHDVILKRLTFLREVLNKITDWDNVVFLGDTWLYTRYTVSKTRTDDTGASTSKAPSGKGERFIVCHAGSVSEGFIPDCLLAFASETTKDTHEDNNFEVFKDWFLKLLSKLKSPTKIIMDNARYYAIEVDEVPNEETKKEEITAWLVNKGVEASPTLLKAELLNLVKLIKPMQSRYVIDELALEHGHEVIRIPPHHCQYNAIELIWKQIKSHVVLHNTEPPYTIKKMVGLLQTACQEVTTEDWRKAIEKTKKIILQDFERDVKIDNIIENEIIITRVESDHNVDDDSDDNDSSNSSE